MALPRPADVPADAAHHLAAQAQKHHLLLVLRARLQQRGRELLHKHGDLQHHVAEVHHVRTVSVTQDGDLHLEDANDRSTRRTEATCRHERMKMTNPLERTHSNNEDK